MRTVLQHAWAEIEHKLRYKLPSGEHQSEELKADDKRQWAMMAALLESVDDRFVERKLFLTKHQVQSIIVPEDILGTRRSTPPDYAYERKGERYWYFIEHRASERPIEIQPKYEFFDLDRRVQQAGGLSNYKNSMWMELKKREPAFIQNLASYDSTSARVCEWDCRAGNLVVQPVQYTDSVVTNHCKVADLEIPGLPGKTPRTLSEMESGRLKTFSESPLANAIGVACVIRTLDNRWVIGRRGEKLAFDPGTWACPASGALEWGERGEWGHWDFDGWIKASMALECEQELGLCVPRRSIIYLAFARELSRLGKPQFFFFVDMLDGAPGLPTRDLEAAWRIYAVDYEVTELMFLEEHNAEILAGPDVKDRTKLLRGGRISEELRMNLALALDYVAEGRHPVSSA